MPDSLDPRFYGDDWSTDEDEPEEVMDEPLPLEADEEEQCARHENRFVEKYGMCCILTQRWSSPEKSQKVH